MQLLCVIISKTDCVPVIVSEMLDKGYGDPTVLSCEGAMHLFENSSIEPPPIFGILRHIANPIQTESKLMLLVLPDEKLEDAQKIIDEKIGGIDNPNTGIMFSLSINNVKGLATR